MKIWTNEETELLIKLYPDFGCDTKIEDKTKTQICKKAYKLGIKVNENRRKYIASKAGYHHRNINYLVNVENFTNLDKYSAYVLGLLWADGYFNSKTGRIDLCCSDDFGPIIYKTGNWTKYTRERKNRKQQFGYCSNNSHLASFFFKYEYHNKSYIEPFILNDIPKSLHSYWWSGFIDGDGCFYYNKALYLREFNVSGAIDYKWVFFQSLLIELGVNYRISRVKCKTGNSSRIRINNIDGIRKIGEYIYNKNDFYLKRKYDKFVEISS